MEKDNRASKVVFSCLIGSALGTLISCSVNLKYFWLGILAGGLIGYLTYDFKQVLIACRSAFKKVFGWRPKPDWQRWKLVAKISFWFNLCSFSWMTPLGLIVGFAIPGNRILHTIILVCTINMCTSLLIIMSVAIVSDVLLEKIHKQSDYFTKYKMLLVYGSSVCLIPLFIFYLLPLGIWWCIRRIPRATVAIGHFFVLLGRFVKTVFILIHSELRLLCGVDALFGALIGFLIKQFYGGTLSTSVIIGACAGAFIGYLNYEIVSKRILKVVPVRK